MCNYGESDRPIAEGIVIGLWFVNDYRKLLGLVEGKYFSHRADTYFYARKISEKYESECGTTPYEVSMWLKKKIEENK